MDRNLLNDRIGLLKEWKQTELLNEILFNALSSLSTYTQDRFDKLTQEIRDESLLNKGSPVIRVAVCAEENTDKHVCLYPVSTTPPVNCPNYITTVFVECDYPTIQKLMQHTYTAEAKSDTGTIQTKVALRYSMKYLQKMKWLYNAFSVNELQWATVNGIYFYKFLDVYSTHEAYSTSDAGNTEENITIDFGGYEKYISYNKVLLWNIGLLTMPVAACEVKPAYNAVLYEHTLKNIQIDDSQYLVCPIGDRFTSFWSGQELRVRSHSKQLEQIELIRITAGTDAENLLYLPPKSNQKKARLVDAMANGRYVPTKGEAERIISSFSEETGLRLADVKMIPHTEENIRQYSGVDYNYFVETNSFLTDRKLLLFTFKTSTEPMWAYEIMFFALSELQLYFYEYRCVGEIV